MVREEGANLRYLGGADQDYGQSIALDQGPGRAFATGGDPEQRLALTRVAQLAQVLAKLTWLLDYAVARETPDGLDRSIIVQYQISQQLRIVVHNTTNCRGTFG